MKTIELFMSTKVLTPIKDGGCERLAGWNRAAVGKKVPGWILEFSALDPEVCKFSQC